MARPPKDPSPVASTGGVANSQGQSIFTGDWNALISDYLSLTDSALQTYQPTADLPISIALKPFTTTTNNPFIVIYDKNGVIQTILPSGNGSIRGLVIQPSATNDNNSGLWFHNPNSAITIGYTAFLRVVYTGAGSSFYTILGTGTAVSPGTGGIIINCTQLWVNSSGGIVDWQGAGIGTRTAQRHLTLDSSLAPAINGDLVLGLATGPTLINEIRTWEGAILAQPIAMLDEAHTTAYQNGIGGTVTPPPVALAGSPGAITNVAASQDHTHGPLSGTVVLINADETQNSATVPNADTTLKTYTLAANSYTSIIAEAEGYGQFGATSTNQTVNIKIKFAGTQKGQTMALDAALAASAKVPFPIKVSGAFTAGGTVTVSIGAAVADANTTVFANSLRVYGVV